MIDINDYIIFFIKQHKDQLLLQCSQSIEEVIDLAFFITDVLWKKIYIFAYKQRRPIVFIYLRRSFLKREASVAIAWHVIWELVSITDNTVL